MNIKVNKPRVNSTLKNYRPRRVDTTMNMSSSSKKSLNHSKSIDRSSFLENRECRKSIKKMEKQEDKEDRLWKVFERERDIRLKESRKREEREYKDQRRKEKKFEKLVERELGKIHSQKEVQKRREEGFSEYVYPMY